MQLYFDENKYFKHKGNPDLSEKSIKGCFPIYLFLVKENEDTGFFDVLYFDW